MDRMDIFTQLVLTIGKLGPNGIQMLGTGFLVTKDGKLLQLDMLLVMMIKT